LYFWTSKKKNAVDFNMSLQVWVARTSVKA